MTATRKRHLSYASVTVAVGVLLASSAAYGQVGDQQQTDRRPPAIGAAGRNGAGAAAPDMFTWSLSAGASRTDNVRRVSDNKEAETSGDAAFRMELAATRQRLATEVSTNLQYRRYFDSDIGNDLIGGLNGTAVYSFIPERFTWMATDNFGQTAIDTRAVETVDNRQNTNFFTTGPDFMLPIGDRTEATAQARYSTSSFETTDADDERRLFGLGLVRRLSTRASVSLNGTTEKVKYKEPIPGLPNDGYTRNSEFVGFTATGHRTTLSVQAGGTQVKDFGDTINGPFANVILEREIGARSTFTLNLGTALTDSAETFRRDQSIGGVVLGNEDVPITADPFQSDFATASWAITGVRTSLTFFGDYRSDDHERDETFNRKMYDAGVTASQRVSGQVGLTATAQWRHENYEVTDDAYREWSVGGALDWYLSRTVSINLRGDHYVGSGDSPLGIGLRDYTENRVSVFISFSPRR